MLMRRESAGRIIVAILMEAEFFAVSPNRGRAGENDRQTEENNTEPFHTEPFHPSQLCITTSAFSRGAELNQCIDSALCALTIV